MAEFAVVLGEEPSVHFVRLEAGSTVLVQSVDDEALPKIRERVRRVKAGKGPADAINAVRRINRILRQDNGVGIITEDEGAEIFRFPGRELKEAVTFGAFNQEGALDGVLIRLGGTGDPVPVHLQAPNALHTHCLARRDLAKTLGQYIFGPEIRIHGTGRWQRNEEGQWELRRFTIGSFEILDERPLTDVVAHLRTVPGSEWPDIEDPWKELNRIRQGDDEVH